MEREDLVNLRLAREELNKLLAYRETLINYYKSIKMCLDSLETWNEEFLFLPFGNDAFVKVKIIEKDFVIIGVGGGIFLEMKINEAKDFLNRKMKKIEEEIKEVDIYIQAFQMNIIEILNEAKRKK